MNATLKHMRQVIQQNKIQRRCLSLTLVLCMLVSFFTPLWPVFPVIAAAPTGAIELGKEPPNNSNDTFFISVYANGNIETGESIYSSNGIVDRTDPIRGDSVHLYVYIEYHLEGISETYFKTNSPEPEMYVDATTLFDEAVRFELSETAATGDLSDSDYIDKHPDGKVGTYEISDGYIYFYLDPAYRRYLEENKIATGTFEFDGDLGAGKTSDNSQTFKIADQEIKVDFNVSYPEAAKKVESINAAEGTVTWQLEFKNNENLNLKNYVFSDNMLQYAVGDITKNPPNFEYTAEGGNYKITSETSQTATITYKTKITNEMIEAGFENNKFELWNPAYDNPDGNPSHSESTAKAEFDNKNPVSITKQGVPDYVGNPENMKGKINWTITVENRYGATLNGYRLKDTMDGNPLDLSTTTVTPAGCSLELKPDGTYAINTNGAEVSSVQIKYTSNADQGQTYTNKAEVYYPTGDTPIKDIDPSVTYEKESSFYTTSKEGKYDADSGLITWEITLNGENNKKLSGYEVTDKAFPNNIDDFEFINGSSSDVTYDAVNHKLTVASDTSYLKFKYTTKAVDGGVNMAITNKQTVTNTITDNKGNEPVTEKVDVTPRNEFHKSSLSQSSQVKTNNEITKELEWKVELIKDAGFKGYTYVDTPQAPSGATHTADISSVSVKTASNKELTKDVDYTLTETGNGFTIVFNEIDSNSEFNKVYINYKTEAKIAADSDYGSYQFNNKGEGDGNTATEPGPSISKDNPSKVETQTIKLKKEWMGDVRNDNNPPYDSVTYKLRYKTNIDNTWHYVKGTGNPTFIYDDDAGYDEAEDYTVVIDNKPYFYKDNITGLRKTKDMVDANGDGAGTITYHYQAVEYKIGDYEVHEDDKFITTENGFIRIVNSGDYDLNDPYLVVTNYYYKNDNLKLKKNWSGEAGSGDGIDKVSYKVQYQLARQPDPTNEYYFEGWTAWTDLYVNADGKYNFEDSTGTPVAGDLTRDSGWAKEISGLPTRLMKDDGSVYKIQYKVIETSVQDGELGDFIDGKLIVQPVDGKEYVEGYYDIQNPQDITNGGDIDVNITNQFHRTAPISIGVTKKWPNIDGYEDCLPDYVKVNVVRSEDGYNNWQPIDGVYPKTLNPTNDWKASWDDEALITQVIDETTKKITTYHYKVVEVGYSYNGKYYDLPYTDASINANDYNGQPKIKYTTDADKGAFIITNSDTIEGYQSSTKEVEVKNEFEKLNISIIPKKVWYDVNNTDQRPEAIVVALMRNLEGTDEWEEVGEVTLTHADQNLYEQNSWVKKNDDGDFFEFENLPRKNYVKDSNGTVISEKWYTYKLVEKSYGTETDLTPIAGNKFRTENGSYEYYSPYNRDKNSDQNEKTTWLELRNTYKESVGISKDILDSNGNHATPIYAEDLKNWKKITIGTDDYYVFNWVISYDSDKVDTLTPVVDTLQDGFILIEDPSNNQSNNNLYWPNDGVVHSDINTSYAIRNNNDGYNRTPLMLWEGTGIQYVRNVDMSQFWNSAQGNNIYHYDKTENKIYFGVPGGNSSMPKFVYSTAIKCTDLEAKLKDGKKFIVKNNAERYDVGQGDSGQKIGIPTGQTAEAKLEIKNNIPSDLISKTFIDPKNYGRVRYSLDINPQGLNLSTGDTIDITDLFKTVRYYDHVNGQWYTGDHLVDVLLLNMQVYEVSANGVSTLLNPNEYTLKFDSSKTTQNGAALLNLTVPDEKHLKIDYLYSLVANDKTPSVLNGRKSSIMKNGRLIPMKPGLTPPSGDKVELKNEANLHSDSADANATSAQTEYTFSQSKGSIWSEKAPKLVKVDVSDYMISDLETKFLLAKYEHGAWYYAQSVSPDSKITWLDNPMTGKSVDTAAGEIYVETGVNLDLSTEVLYKLVEVSVPEGYEGSNLQFKDGATNVVYEDDQEKYNEYFKSLIIGYLNTGETKLNGVDYSTFLNKFISTFYFTYNSEAAKKPADVDASEIQKIKQNGELNIPNNQLINLKVDKTWIQVPDDTNASVEVKLYWSFTKDKSKIPADAQLFDPTLFGISTSFDVTAKINYGETYDKWKDLPNGKDGKPVYYYVKETAYTVNDITYTLDEKDGMYKTSSGSTLNYYPTYINNAVCSDSKITVENSKALRLHKVWKNANGEDLGLNIPVNSIEVTVYGITEEGAEEPVFENVTILSDNNWYAELNANGKDLSKYVSYKATESGTQNLESFTVSCVFNINNGTGEITVTNKDTSLTEVAVSVTKEWSDGAENHVADNVTFELWRTTTKISSSQVKDLTLDAFKDFVSGEVKEESVTLNGENDDWTHVWKGLAAKDDDGNDYYYYVFETSGVEKYTPIYNYDDSVNGLTNYTITNKRSAIMVHKDWLDENGYPITDTSSFAPITLNIINEKTGEVERQKSLSYDNNWSAIVDVDDDSATYKIEEVNVSGYWEVTYENQYQLPGSSTVINAINTYKPSTIEISVEKTWIGDEGDIKGRDKISLVLLRTTKTNPGEDDWVDSGAEMPTPTVEDNVWTYKYTNLAEKDSNGNTYRYKVEEDPLAGYEVDYSAGEANGITSGTLHITNTRRTAIKVVKDWSEVDDARGYEVFVQIHRGVKSEAESAERKEKVDLILDLSGYSVFVGKDETNQSIKANKAVTAKSADVSIATVTVDDSEGKIIKITGVKSGTTTITVTDGVDEKVIDVTVSALSITAAETMNVGSKVTLAVKEEGNDVDADISFEPSDIVYYNSEENSIIALKPGNVKITASKKDDPTVKAEYEIEVGLPEFSVSGVPAEDKIEKDGTATITIVPVETPVECPESYHYDYGFSWTSSDSSKISVAGNGLQATITGKDLGTATIKATNTYDSSKSYEFNLEVIEPQKITVGPNAKSEVKTNPSEVKSIFIELHDVNTYNGTFKMWFTDSNCLEINVCQKFTDYWGSYGSYASVAFSEDKMTLTVTIIDTPNKILIETSAGYNLSYTVKKKPAPSPAPRITTAPSAVNNNVTAPGPRFTKGLGLSLSNVNIIMDEIQAAPKTAVIYRTRQSDLRIGEPTFENDGYINIALNNSNDFEALVSDLEVYNSVGEEYYYWVEEYLVEYDNGTTKTDVTDRFAASYKFDDEDDTTDYSISAVKSGISTATIRNTMNPDVPVELPESGGTGTKPYTAAGIAIMLLSGTTTLYFKRRSRRERKNA